MTLQRQQYSMDRARLPKVSNVREDTSKIRSGMPHSTGCLTAGRWYGGQVLARQEGLTIVELLVSIAVTVVLMLAIVSVMLIATHAFPDVNGPANATIVASEVAEQFATELQYAVSIKDYSTTMIEFTVADRNADELPETIRYEWSGTPGDPLTRQYNGGTIVNVLDGVQQFEGVSREVELISSEEITPENESPEYPLSNYETPVTPADVAIKETVWVGQYFEPILPADAISWKVTRVIFMARRNGDAKGVTAVQLRLPNAFNRPTTTVLGEVPMYEESLSTSYLKQEFSFSNVSGLSPSQGLCLVLACRTSDTALADVQYDNAGGSGGLWTTDGGSTWIYLYNRSMLYKIYGTVTTVGEPQIENTYCLKAVGIKLRTTNDEQSAVYAGTNVLNKPEVTQ
jgi:hypothetical protein